VFGIVFPVGIVDDAAAFVGRHLILVDDPFEGASVAEFVFVDLGGSAGEVRKSLLRIWVLSLERDMHSTRQLSLPASLRSREYSGWAGRGLGDARGHRGPS
jgi:hypothetical protein